IGSCESGNLNRFARFYSRTVNGKAFECTGSCTVGRVYFELYAFDFAFVKAAAKKGSDRSRNGNSGKLSRLLAGESP
ncbi:hypothetical protein OFB80_34190, partial [Escherichia coli]|nr:hypothetical protein [Escherichia coli]